MCSFHEERIQKLESSLTEIVSQVSESTMQIKYLGEKVDKLSDNVEKVSGSVSSVEDKLQAISIREEEREKKNATLKKIYTGIIIAISTAGILAMAKLWFAVIVK